MRKRAGDDNGRCKGNENINNQQGKAVYNECSVVGRVGWRRENLEEVYVVCGGGGKRQEGRGKGTSEYINQHRRRTGADAMCGDVWSGRESRKGCVCLGSEGRVRGEDGRRRGGNENIEQMSGRRKSGCNVWRCVE